jgi:hypothetical protein
LNQVNKYIKKYMGKDAHFVKSMPLGDEWADDIVYTLLEEEWRKT